MICRIVYFLVTCVVLFFAGGFAAKALYFYAFEVSQTDGFWDVANKVRTSDLFALDLTYAVAGAVFVALYALAEYMAFFLGRWHAARAGLYDRGGLYRLAVDDEESLARPVSKRPSKKKKRKRERDVYDSDD